MEARFSAEMLPSDHAHATLVGRVLLGVGPTPVIVRDGVVHDVSRAAPTVADLLERDDLEIALRSRALRSDRARP